MTLQVVTLIEAIHHLALINIFLVKDTGPENQLTPNCLFSIVSNAEQLHLTMVFIIIVIFLIFRGRESGLKTRRQLTIKKDNLIFKIQVFIDTKYM